MRQDDGTLGLSVGISEKTHDTIQGGLDAAKGVAGGLSMIFPALAPIAAGLGVGGYTWRRMKKTVVKNKAPLEMLVTSLERLKYADNEAWQKVKTQIQAQYPPLELQGTIENVKSQLSKQGKI